MKDIHDIKIFDENPGLDGYEEMPDHAIDAYNWIAGDSQKEMVGEGDFSNEAKELAIKTVASHFNISPDQALEQYDICIIPGVGFHGRIMAKEK